MHAWIAGLLTHDKTPQELGTWYLADGSKEANDRQSNRHNTVVSDPKEDGAGRRFRYPLHKVIDAT